MSFASLCVLLTRTLSCSFQIIPEKIRKEVRTSYRKEVLAPLSCSRKEVLAVSRTQAQATRNQPQEELLLADAKRSSCACIIFGLYCTQTAVNDARKQLFVKKDRQFDAIPPTRAALLEHSKRAVLQAGYIWGQALIPSPTMPNRQDWGWTLESSLWRPYWTALPDVMSSCQELVRCGFKKGCRRQCSCVKASLCCTALCKCPDECDNR